MKYKPTDVLVLLFSFICFSLHAKRVEEYSTDILIVGGGASGVTAGLHASRLGVWWYKQ